MTQSTLYFWRESHSETGWLSQWYYCPFRDDQDPNKIYFTAEHYMMHQKALLFKDDSSAYRVLSTKNPRAVKSIGRKVSNFDDATWKKRREEIVRKGNMLKFTRAVSEKGFQKGTSAAQNLPPLEESLRDMLVNTGESELVEASPFDAIWGIGFKEEDAKGQRNDWGLNLLGKALMDVRTMLKEEQEKQEEHKSVE